MTDVLDQPVPRELVSQILPESYTPQLDIEPLGEGRVLGSLRHVLKDDAAIHEQRVLEAGFKFVTLINEAETDDVYIIFFSSPDDPGVREGILLEQREIGLMEPPLSINEHLQLATAYGVPGDVQEAFKQRVLLALREEAILKQVAEADSYPMMCKECGAEFNLEAGATNPKCPECGSKYIKKREREGESE